MTRNINDLIRLKGNILRLLKLKLLETNLVAEQIYYNHRMLVIIFNWILEGEFVRILIEFEKEIAQV